MAIGVLVENGPWRALEDVASFNKIPNKNVIDAVGVANLHCKASLGLRLLPVEIKKNQLGKYFLRARGISGTFSTKVFSVNIAPKFAPQANVDEKWCGALLAFVEYSRKRDSIFTRSFNLENSKPNLIDLLAMAFVEAVNEGLKDQLIQTYRLDEYRLPSIRGRLNLNRQIKSIYERPHLFECDVDQLNSINAYNSFLKWGALMFSEKVQSSQLRRSLMELSQKFPGASSSVLTHGQMVVNPPPQFWSWKPALEICSMLHSGIALSAGMGSKHGYSMLFNMEKLFEQFVERIIHHAVQLMAFSGLRCVAQASTPYAVPITNSNRKYFSKPDNLIFGDSGPIAIVDAKYKRLSNREGVGNRKPQNPDIYELVAGMTAHKCNIGLLIYPKVYNNSILNDDELKVWQVESFGRTLTVASVALDLIMLKERKGRDSLARRVGEVLDQLLSM